MRAIRSFHLIFPFHFIISLVLFAIYKTVRVDSIHCVLEIILIQCHCLCHRWRRGNKTLNFYWFQSGNLNLKNNTFYICFTYCIKKTHPFKDICIACYRALYWLILTGEQRRSSICLRREPSPSLDITTEVEAFQGVGQLSDCKHLQAEGVTPPSRPRRKYDMGFQE